MMGAFVTFVCLMLCGVAFAHQGNGIHPKFNQLKYGEYNDNVNVPDQHIEPKRAAKTMLVAFSATQSQFLGPYTQTTQLQYNTVEFNYGGGFDPATSTFTAPVKGIYRFDFVGRAGTEGPSTLNLKVNGNYQRELTILAPISIAGQGGIFPLEVGDQVSVEILSSHGTGFLQCNMNNCLFAGYLLEQLL